MILDMRKHGRRGGRHSVVDVNDELQGKEDDPVATSTTMVSVVPFQSSEEMK